MGCGASGLALAGPHLDGKAIREYSATIANLRAVSSMSSDTPVAMGHLKVLQQEFSDIKDVYAIGRLLGKGQFGTCRLVLHKARGDRYACKSISKRRLASVSDVADVRREVAIMHHLAGHPNIVTIKDVFEDRGYVHLVQELCTGGELFDSIIERGHYSERDAAAAFRCIASVVAHCHNMGVMHRDIKPENFLLSSRGANAAVKGTDFGLSVFFSEGQVFKEVVGSAFYVAPEVLRKRYDKRADIWSLGVLLYILLCGTPPFYAETERDIFQAILSLELCFEGEVWAAVSRSAKDVIRRMLERNPSLRATASEVLEHEWVRENGSAEAHPLDNEVLTRLQNFAALNKLQQEALKIIAVHLPEAEITGLRALFTEMDSDGSGSITVEELRQALQRKGTRIPREELQRIMAQADISGDGTLDYEEFLAATMNLAKLERQENLYLAFKFFDTDDSGFITREELSSALYGSCGPGEIDALMRQADSSGDGRIDYGEFCDLMRCGNKTLPRVTRTVKQGLMRSAASQLDLSRMRLESISAPDGKPLATIVTTPPQPAAAVGSGGGSGGTAPGQLGATSPTPSLSPMPPPSPSLPQQQRRSAPGGGGGDVGGGGGSSARLSSSSGLPAVALTHPTPTPRRLNTNLGSRKGNSTTPQAPPTPPAAPAVAAATPLSPLSLSRRSHQLLLEPVAAASATASAASVTSSCLSKSPLPMAVAVAAAASPPSAVAANALHAESFTCGS